jgi:hypothetical protein
MNVAEAEQPAVVVFVSGLWRPARDDMARAHRTLHQHNCRHQHSAVCGGARGSEPVAQHHDRSARRTVLVLPLFAGLLPNPDMPLSH